jgi:hypothetical protein
MRSKDMTNEEAVRNLVAMTFGYKGKLSGAQVEFILAGAAALRRIGPLEEENSELRERWQLLYEFCSGDPLKGRLPHVEVLAEMERLEGK